MKFTAPFLLVGFVTILSPFGFAQSPTPPESPTGEEPLQVGAAVVDVTPRQLPVPVLGSITPKTADRITDPLAARAIVVGRGDRRLAVCIVDNCAISEALINRSIEKVNRDTGIPPAAIMIAATHTHSAPAVISTHGNDADVDYAGRLSDLIAKSIVRADGKRRPARYGYAAVDLDRWVHVRRWLMKPGTARSYPFTGRDGDHAQMNPGFGNPDRIRPVGTADPSVTLLAFRDLKNRPIAALVNYNTHYAGAPQISSDYFGVVARGLGEAIGAGEDFVTLSSNGNSGNVNCIDFTRADGRQFNHIDVGNDVIAAAKQAYRSIQDWRDRPEVDWRLDRPAFRVRRPQPAETKRAESFVRSWIDQRGPGGWTESYARETTFLAEYPETMEIPLRSFRIGDFAICGIPNEVFGETGLKIKSQSPFPRTIVIGWAGGYHGYLPTPEAFDLGGYTTWRCRSSYLAEDAEPRVVELVLEQLQGCWKPGSDAPSPSTESE